MNRNAFCSDFSSVYSFICSCTDVHLFPLLCSLKVAVLIMFKEKLSMSLCMEGWIFTSYIIPNIHCLWATKRRRRRQSVMLKQRCKKSAAYQLISIVRQWYCMHNNFLGNCNKGLASETELRIVMLVPEILKTWKTIYGKLEMQNKSSSWCLRFPFHHCKHQTVPSHLINTPFLLPYTTCPFLFPEPTLPHVFALL